jgi:hypothetical protein
MTQHFWLKVVRVIKRHRLHGGGRGRRRDLRLLYLLLHALQTQEQKLVAKMSYKNCEKYDQSTLHAARYLLRQVGKCRL